MHDEQVPPHDLDAEAATLGAMLLDPEAINTVSGTLLPDDFFKKAHALVFEAILSLAERDSTDGVDLITVTDELRANGALDTVGGPGFVASLGANVPSAANVDYYARIVRESSNRRRLLRAAREIISEVFDSGMESRVVMEEAERRIFEIAENTNSNQFVRARDLVGDAVEQIEKLIKSGRQYTGVPTGFGVLDKLLSGFQKSEFIIIGARPSIGKTAFALSMAANIAIDNKVPVGFFTLEMSNLAIMQRLLASVGRVSSEKLRTGMLRSADLANLTEAAGRIYEAPLWINDTPSIKLLDLRAQARRMRSQHNIEILFIDYLTLITNESRNVPRHEQVADISRSLKSLARELEIPVVALSQVSRDAEDRRPNLANIRESGSIEQDADVVIFLHRDRGAEKDDDDRGGVVETEVIVAKQRNGPVGLERIAFVKEYTRFDPLAHESI